MYTDLKAVTPYSAGMNAFTRSNSACKASRRDCRTYDRIDGARRIRMIVMPEGFLAGVRKLCTAYDVLMIVDEVATGFGRTGKMFACEHENVQPDLMAAGKGITGGYLPIAVTFATEAIYEAFYDDYDKMKTFFHGHSYTGNQLGCAAAIENLRLFESERIVEQVAEKSKTARNFFMI